MVSVPSLVEVIGVQLRPLPGEVPGSHELAEGEDREPHSVSHSAADGPRLPRSCHLAGPRSSGSGDGRDVRSRHERLAGVQRQ